MTLLYMFFENTISLDDTYKGIKPNTNGYKFDNRFNVEFDKDNKTFYITDNPNYVQIYNNAISNFSCIVGRNGSGKTTFLELLITNVVWGITERQPQKMVSIYYEKVGDKYNFKIHAYLEKNDELNYKVSYQDREEVDIYNKHKSWNSYTNKNDFTSTLPDSTKFIFHSLSPFDKIFYAISKKLKGKEYTTSHYIKQMRYVGNQNFIKNEPSHEILTITNLLKVFSSEYFKKPFHDCLGYSFSGLEIDIDFRKVFNSELFSSSRAKAEKIYENIIINITNKDYFEYEQITSFMGTENLKRKELIVDFIHNSTFGIRCEVTYLIAIILDNINFKSFESDIELFELFLEVMEFKNHVKDSYFDKWDIYINVLNVLKFNSLGFIENYEFIDYLKLVDIELFKAIFYIKSSSFEEVIKKVRLIDFIYLVRRLKNKGYLEFEILLNKEDEKESVNYFYLSSGEKTMISYFANLSNAMTEFGEIDNKTFIILIDEVELHLHPKWQISFIDYMNRFFKENGNNVKFQFIIATHSPFVLSDIVEDQIIYINEEEKTSNEFNTFGANIYDIFEKGFFLDNSIGKCSENFIKNISDEFHLFKAIHLAKNNDFFLLKSFREDYSNDNSELLKKELLNLNQNISDFSYIEKRDELFYLKQNTDRFINIIGEPVVKNHLLGLFESLKGLSIENK